MSPSQAERPAAGRRDLDALAHLDAARDLGWLGAERPLAGIATFAELVPSRTPVTSPAKRLPRRVGQRLGLHSTTNVLLVCGSAGERQRTARALHVARAAPLGPYRAIDCTQQQSALCEALSAWLLADGRQSNRSPFMGLAPGTLFVDRIEVLTPESQRLLLLMLERLADITAVGEQRPIGRFIAGSHVDLAREVNAGRFLGPLYDALNKARFVLSPRAVRRQREAIPNFK